MLKTYFCVYTVHCSGKRKKNDEPKTKNADLNHNRDDGKNYREREEEKFHKTKQQMEKKMNQPTNKNEKEIEQNVNILPKNFCYLLK